MVCSAIKAIGTYDWAVRADVKLVDELIDTLEIWFRWVSTIAIETVDGVNDIRAGILHNT